MDAKARKLMLGTFLFWMLPGLAVVHEKPNGVGEVLYLPYFTVNNDLNTLVSFTNTTEYSKATKVVVRDGHLGQPVAAYNVYLAPYDSWTFAFVATDDGATMVSNDLSCSPGFSSPMDLSTTFSDPSDEPLLNMFEGTIEIYEMGFMSPESGFGLDVTFEDGVVRDCGQIEENWAADGAWAEDPSDGVFLAQGGLRATSVLVDVTQGISYDMPATALAGYYRMAELFHTAPDVADSPSAADANLVSGVAQRGNMIYSVWPTGFEAVSAVLMKHKIFADYSIEDAIFGETEMIISFPTKHFYVQDEVILEPFDSYDWPTNFYSCELFGFDLRNRDGFPSYRVPGGVSPRPPILCAHSNGFKVYDIDPLGRPNDHILDYSQGFYGLWVDENQAGTFAITFDQLTFSGKDLTDNSVFQFYQGLPLIGAVFQRYANANAQPGLLAQYGTGSGLTSETLVGEAVE